MSEPALAIRLAWALVHFLWQGVLLGLVAWVVLTLLRRKRPEVRYAASCLCLIGCLALPVWTLLVQGAQGGQVSPEVAATASYRLLIGFRSHVAAWLPLLLVLWGLGSLALGLRALGSWFWLRRLGGRAAEVLEGRCLDLLADLRQGLGIGARVRLLESSKVRGPFVHGLLNPVIFVPLGFITAMDPVALRAVLAHELAHIRRLDVLVIGLQTLIETLLYYHPVTWWLSRRVTTERECCCDAVAAQACGDPILFARTLHRLDELRADAVPALAGGNLMERIQRLLKRDPGPGRIPTPLLSLGFAASASLLMVQQPEVQAALRQLPHRISGADALGDLRQQAQGTVAAIQAPAKDLRISRALTSLEDLPPATALSEVPVLSPIEPREPPKAASVGVETEKALGQIDPSRLGIPFQAFLGRPIEPWPEGARVITAEALPRDGDPWELDWVLGRPGKGGPYAFTTWPATSIYDRRFLRLNVPAGQRAEVRVTGLSGTRRDAHFSLGVLHLKSLVGGAWSAPPLDASSGGYVITNHADGGSSCVLLLSGPRKTPYRCEVTFSKVEAARAAAKAVSVTPWPEGEAGVGVQEPGAPSSEGLKQIRIGWVQKRSGPFSNPDLRTMPEVSSEEVGRLRCFGVMVHPGEKVRCSVTKGSAVLEAALPDDQGSRWDKAVMQANLDPERTLRQRLEVTNPTARPQPFVLVAYQVGRDPNGYAIELERIPR